MDRRETKTPGSRSPREKPKDSSLRILARRETKKPSSRSPQEKLKGILKNLVRYNNNMYDANFNFTCI